jgi:predicted SprT family Zn-dependent metalloprotease
MKLYAAETAARAAMREHGLTAQGWTFHWAKGKRTFGTCVHGRRQIRLSRHLVALNVELEVNDTILHEIAHALVGPGNGHNFIWKAKCREIGARAQRCFTDETVVSPPHKYETICNTCNIVTRKHFRRRKDSVMARYRCTKCKTANLEQVLVA